MEDYDITESDDKISKINSAGLINLRLHILWLKTHSFADKGMYSSWNTTLDRLWCEMAGDVFPTEKGNSKDDLTLKEFENINEKVEEVSPLGNWKVKEGFEDLEKPKLEIQKKQYKALMNKEIFLRRLQNKQGKGTAYRDSSEDYMDN